MADFEEARFILSLHGQISMLVCESRVNPDHFCLFKKKKVKRLAIGGEVMYFDECVCNLQQPRESHGSCIARPRDNAGSLVSQSGQKISAPAMDVVQ
uniref:Uncharacterized protein n=1 Tax=Romanomermis culicivorax TaxID=13658 RepID=A0A915KUH7_ROMCU